MALYRIYINSKWEVKKIKETVISCKMYKHFEGDTKSIRFDSKKNHLGESGHGKEMKDPENIIESIDEFIDIVNGKKITLPKPEIQINVGDRLDYITNSNWYYIVTRVDGKTWEMKPFSLSDNNPIDTICTGSISDLHIMIGHTPNYKPMDRNFKVGDYFTWSDDGYTYWISRIISEGTVELSFQRTSGIGRITKMQYSSDILVQELNKERIKFINNNQSNEKASKDVQGTDRRQEIGQRCGTAIGPSISYGKIASGPRLTGNPQRDRSYQARAVRSRAVGQLLSY
jgi:hypothetical protein